jgi:hypothetical protein
MGTTTHRIESSSTDNTLSIRSLCVQCFQRVASRASGVFIGIHTPDFECVRTCNLASVRLDSHLHSRSGFIRLEEYVLTNAALSASSASISLLRHQVYQLPLVVITGLAVRSLVANEVVVCFSHLPNLGFGRLFALGRQCPPQVGVLFRESQDDCFQIQKVIIELADVLFERSILGCLRSLS